VGTLVHALCFCVVVYVYTDLEYEVLVAQERMAKEGSRSGGGGGGGGERAGRNVVGAGDDSSSVHGSSTESPLQQRQSPSSRNRAGFSPLFDGEDEEAWWDDLSFLGIESKLAGRTSLNRPVPGSSQSIAQVLASWAYAPVGLVQGLLLGPSGAASRKASGTGRVRKGRFAYGQGGTRSGASGTGAGAGSPGSSSAAAPTEYELVRSYTDALRHRGGGGEGDGDDESDITEIDFDFI
jgi:hypothetical protein